MASRSNKKQPTHFQPVTDAQEVLAYFLECGKTQGKSTFWTQGQKNKCLTQVLSFNQVDRSLQVALSKDFDLPGFLSDLKDQGNEDCFFSVTLSSANLFFQARYVSHTGTTLKFHRPEKLFKVQRRAHSRFTIPDGHVLSIEFTDLLFPKNRQKKHLLDLSVGGLSFEVPASEAVLYSRGTRIPKIELTIRLKPFIFDGEVKSRKLIKIHETTESTARISISIDGLIPEDLVFLKEYIEEKIRMTQSQQFLKHLIYV